MQAARLFNRALRPVSARTFATDSSKPLAELGRMAVHFDRSSSICGLLPHTSSKTLAIYRTPFNMTDSEKLDSLLKLMKGMDSRMGALEENTAKGTSSLENRMGALEASLENRMGALEETTAKGASSLENRMGGLGAKLDKIQGSLDEFRGETNERALRKAAAKKYGEPFSKNFNIQGLEGLAHLILPSKREGQGYSPRPENLVNE